MREIDLDEDIMGMRNVLGWARGNNVHSWLTFYYIYGEKSVNLKVTSIPFIHMVNKNRYWQLTNAEVLNMILPRII